jgi:hypothetical protein
LPQAGTLLRSEALPVNLVLPEASRAAGTSVVWRRYPGLDHSATVNASVADSLPFAQPACRTPCGQ